MPILDHRGQPATIQRIGTLDRSFWQTSSNTASYLSQVEKEPYRYHVWVYRCVSAIAMNVGQLDPVLYEEAHPENTVAKHPILDLLNEPNPLMTSYGAMRQYLVSLLLLPTRNGGSGGQAYILAWNGKTNKPAELDKGELPTELMPMGEDQIQPRTEEDKDTKRRRLVGWWMGERGSPKEKKTPLPIGSVIRICLPNPYDYLAGMSPLMSVELAVNTDAKSDVYNARVFENDGAVAGVISTDEVLPPDVKEDNLKEWMSTYGGLNKRRNIALLDGGLKYQQMSMTMKDMEWRGQKEWGRDAIMSAFGLNKIGLGQIETLSLATIREGRKILWYDTYMPIDKMICEAINSAWIEKVDNGRYRLRSDYNHVEALRGDMSEKVVQVAQLVTAGAPFSLACKIVGIDISADDLAKWPELDEIRQSMPSILGGFGGSNDKEDPPKKPKEDDEEADEDDEDKDKSAKARSVRIEMTEREKMVDEYAKSVLVPMENTFYKQLNRHFVSQRNQVLDSIDEWYDKQKKTASLPCRILLKQVENAPDIERLLFDVNKELERIMAAYRPTAKRATEIEMSHINAELGGGITYNVSNELMDRWLVERMVLMGDIESATFKAAHDAIASAVSDAFDENLTVRELQIRIKENVQDVYRVRLGQEIKPHGKFDLGGMSSSMTIARTEMGIITAQTRFDAFRTEGIETWEWVTSKDDRVRDAHVMRDGEVVRVGEPFPISVRGSFVTYPRDPNGDVADLINCRCVAVAAEGV